MSDLNSSGALAWLIEAPGHHYLGKWHLGVHGFYWTKDPWRALRFYSEEQADHSMMGLRELQPDLFAFAFTLGDARAVEHKFIAHGEPVVGGDGA